MTIKNTINFIKSIDLVALRNIGTFLLAKAGKNQAIMEMAIQYLVENNDEKASPYVIYIENNNLRDKFPIISDYYDFCLDYHFRYSYDELFSFNEYALKRAQYRHQWYVTKRAINDRLILKYDINTALSLTSINDDDSNDFIKYVFKNITDKKDLLRILLQKSNLLKEALIYGYRDKYLDLKDLINISFCNEETAKTIVSMIQMKQFSKTIKKKQLIKWVFELGTNFASVRFECSQICLQFGSAENAKILLSDSKTCPQSYEDILNKTDQTSYPNHLAKEISVENTNNNCSISYTAFNEVHKYYLSSHGFFSYQSNATKEIINKASQTNLSDHERYQVLKQYTDNKENYNRKFRTCLMSIFSNKFRKIEASNDTNNHNSIKIS